MMNEVAADVMSTAIRLITSERAEVYGPYEEETRKEVEILNTLFDLDLKPYHMPIILLVVKLVRESHVHKQDNAVDGCGYLSLYNQLREGGTE